MGSARKNNPAYLYSRADGDDLIGYAAGLARLTPSVYFGDSSPNGNGVSNYMAQAQLNHFRVQVAEIKSDGGSSPRSTTMLDLDSRSLYFGQTDISPSAASTWAGEHASHNMGKGIAGLPVSFKQVSFRAFGPRGGSDEYSAFFLVSNPIGGYGAFDDQTEVPSAGELIDSDIALHRDGATVGEWCNNGWMKGKSESSAVYDFEDRLIIGDPLMTEDNIYHYYSQLYDTNYFDILGWNANAGVNTEGYNKNTYNIKFDNTSLITRQTHVNGEAYAKGWDYKLPFEASVAGRWTFYFGKYLEKGDAGWTTPPKEAVIPSSSSQRHVDHWDVKYFTPEVDHVSEYVDTTSIDPDNEYWRQKIMRRFKPQIGKIYGCLDGNNWTLIDLVPGSDTGGEDPDGSTGTDPDKPTVPDVPDPGPDPDGGDSHDHDLWTEYWEKLTTYVKTYYSIKIVQAGSKYGGEINLIDGEYVTTTIYVNVWNKRVKLGGTGLSDLGSRTKIWVKASIKELTTEEIEDGKNRRDKPLIAEWETGGDTKINDNYTQYYLVADTAANWTDNNGEGGTPVTQHIMGDIYDRNVPVPELWPETITKGNAFDVLQLSDKKNGPPEWYTLRAQSYWV